MFTSIQHSRAIALLALLSVSVLGQDRAHAPSPLRPQDKEPRRDAVQKEQPQATQGATPIKGFDVQSQLPAICPPTAAVAASANEPRESFSEFTLFLFASALALFVALLGWSDQIRG